MMRFKQCLTTGRVDVTEASDLLRRAKALVFDFDGTLVDSNEIKAHAFAVCFAEFPKHHDRILAYCCGNHHLSRSEKMRYVYEEILQLPYSADAEAQLQKRFAAATTQQIIHSPQIPGATQFLSVAKNNYRTALLSNTPQDILFCIIEARGWRGYFDQIRGAPVQKGEWLTMFCKQQLIQPRKTVFVGDTQEDYDASRQAGCMFIGVGSASFRSSRVCSIPDFRALLC